jgi:hypothetical protein
VLAQARSRRRRRIVSAAAGLVTLAVLAGVTMLVVPGRNEAADRGPIAFAGWEGQPAPVIGYGAQPGRIEDLDRVVAMAFEEVQKFFGLGLTRIAHRTSDTGPVCVCREGRSAGRPR